MKRMVFAVILVLVFVSCSNETSALPSEMPDDFDFSLHFGYGSNNELNTFEDTFTKDLIENGQETTDMILTDAEKSIIYEKMRDANVLDVADHTQGSPCMDPHPTYDLTLQARGETYSQVWDTSCTSRHTERWETFMDFLYQEIIEPKPEYQKLPKAVGGYD
ncbi:hypothetical protein [Alteribacter aurantiacus]|uniref:hypothetical protein n=1 Tax=Alteribacter aurantiacus TaxID=254410 RepID=UPI0004242C5F|nr:hypothetical protein [Alteribacter aurantiacus]